MINGNNRADDKIILEDRPLTREITQVLQALKDTELPDEQRRQLKDKLRLCLDQLTALMGIGKKVKT